MVFIAESNAAPESGNPFLNFALVNHCL
jgi:hypothetical protein